MRYASLSVVLAVFSLGTVQAELLPNGEFNAGGQKPDGWTLSGGQGNWDRQHLSVTGNGNDSNFWRTDCTLSPGGFYWFEVRLRRTSGDGSAIVGPALANRDTLPANSWSWQRYAFRVPDGAGKTYIRLGQWHARGTIEFDTVRLSRALPVHQDFGGLALGDGESLNDGVYTFQGSYAHNTSNHHRPLARATPSFNSDRWGFGANDELIYRFELPGYRLLGGKAEFHLNYHIVGGAELAVSRNGSQWHAIASRSELGNAAADLPASLLPANVLYLRVRSLPGKASFQINHVEFQARVEGPPRKLLGRTEVAVIEPAESLASIRAITLGEKSTAVAPAVNLELAASAACALSVAPSVADEDGRETKLPAQSLRLEAGQSGKLPITLPPQAPGEHRLTVVLSADGKPAARATLPFSVHDYYRHDYGARLAGVQGPAAVWWCDAGHKIPRQRALPTATAEAATLSAARGDREAVQIIVAPQVDLKNLKVEATPLVGPGGHTIARERIRLLRVHYHYVEHPTDRSSVRDFWPDALPPLAKPVDVPAGQNQPIWVLVDVPRDAVAGDYRGSVTLSADGFRAEAPLRLHVWNFTLPERNHVETAYGFSPGNVFRYHQLKTEADKRHVLDLYFQCLSEHRISPYDPTPLDPIRTRFVPEANPPRAEVDFTAFDRAMRQAVERYHFSTFRLALQGMGGGTFESRHPPKIGKFDEGTPQYQAMFASQVQQIERHLREKGWLDMAYVYWFDEPDPKDYGFVINGMRRLKQYAPGLRRMLTEQPEPELQGAVDLWCPVSNAYDHARAEPRRAAGEQFWWYVCTGPKAPYCTLFIDHPATEMRVWLWQTWQRKITGTLVWETNYWTSPSAFPQQPQNPYDDPMGYVSHSVHSPGVRQFWGNGDGRFVYPPEAAAVPGASGPGPVLAPPVSCLRLEMLREGIEDYEYLYLLRERMAARRARLSAAELARLESLLDVPASITTDATSFTTDPAPILARRAAVAEAIERLGE